MKNCIRPLFAVAALSCLVSPSDAQLQLHDTKSFLSSDTGAESGAAFAIGDFNGDGRDDLAIGRPGVNEVQVRFGALEDPQGSTETVSERDTEDFGAALAACDFDADGADELVVGAPATDLAGIDHAGRVYLYRYDFDFVLTSTLDELTPGIGDTAEPFDQFGASLLAGRLDDDCDLAVGVIGETVDGMSEAGVVRLFAISEFFAVSHLRDFDATSLGGEASPSARFGSAMASGNFTSRFDFRNDLAIAAPTQAVNGIAGPGAVYVFFNTSGSVSNSIGDTFTEERLFVPSVNTTSFGVSLAAGNIDDDKFDDLVIGSPFGPRSGSDSTSIGTVHVLFGGDDSFPDRQLLLQQHLFPGGGAAQALEQFGSRVAVGNVDGDRYDDLVITSTGENGSDGLVQMARGSRSGISAVGALGFTESAVGGASSGDRFGEVLALGDLDGNGSEDLVIGIPRRDFFSRADTGWVYVTPAAGEIATAEVLLSVGDSLPVNGANRTISAILRAEGDEADRVGAFVRFEDSESALVVSSDRETWQSLFDSAAHPSLQVNDADSMAFDSSDRFVFHGVGAPGRGTPDNHQFIFDETGELLRGQDPIPALPGQTAGYLRNAQMGAGQAFFASDTDTNHILREEGDDLVVAIDPDTYLPGTALSLYRYSIARDGNSSGALGFDAASTEYFVVDGVEILREGDSAGDGGSSFHWSDFVYLEIESSGWYLSGRVDDGLAEHAFLQSSDGSSVNADEDALDSTPLHHWSLYALRRKDAKSATLWGQGTGTTLFVSCNNSLESSHRIVGVGDRIDLGSAGVATMTAIRPLSAPLRSSILAVVSLDFGTEQLRSLVELPLPCPAFADGFETGDTGAWSSTVP